MYLLYRVGGRRGARPFHLSEGWQDQAALDKHSNSPDFKETLEQAMKLRILSRLIYVAEAKGRKLVS